MYVEGCWISRRVLATVDYENVLAPQAGRRHKEMTIWRFLGWLRVVLIFAW